MSLTDVVPATVPLDPATGTPVTVPAETHLLYFCRLAPIVPAIGLPNNEYRSMRAQLYRDLCDTVSATLSVDGSQVGLSKETVRPSGVTELGFWNITEPLPIGPHTATFKLTARPESDDELPPCFARPSQKPIPEPGDELVTDVPISVVETRPSDFPTATDPFWNRREVREGRHG